MKPSDALKNSSFEHNRTQNLEFVNLRCFAYSQPIPLLLKNTNSTKLTYSTELTAYKPFFWLSFPAVCQILVSYVDTRIYKAINLQMYT